MRYDIMIIWGHGERHLNKIMVELRAAFEIVMIYKHRIDFPELFIDEVYACDSYPLSHLQAKTKYLITVPPVAYLILVINHCVNEEMVGKDPYRKVQCQYLQTVKNKIRAKYNPPTGRHDHVIHGTDYESQVHHILEVFNQHPLKRYTQQPHPNIPYPWHLPIVDSYYARERKISYLRIHVYGQGLREIQESPHYQYLIGNKRPYLTYHARYVGDVLREDHFPERYDDLIEQWNTTYEVGKKLEYDPILINNHGQILDGAHRVALMRFFNQTTISTLVI